MLGQDVDPCAVTAGTEQHIALVKSSYKPLSFALVRIIDKETSFGRDLLAFASSKL